MKKFLILLFTLIALAIPTTLYASVRKIPTKEKAKVGVVKLSASDIKTPEALLMTYKKTLSNAQIKQLKQATLKLASKAIPVLIKVMKSDDFPDKNRWAATFLVGRIMGKKASPFIAKYSEHPNWIMRLASLKTLLALGEKEYKGLYAKKLQDKSLIVRTQALQNINHFNLTELAPSVWAMLYDKSNYSGMKGKKKRTPIVSEIIRTVGDLKFAKAKTPLLKMMNKKKYKDVHNAIDYSLSKIYDKQSPKGSIEKKKYYWSRIALADKVIK
jgi:HEAT repeat protein